MDDGAPSQIEEIFAQSPITGTSSLPSTDMRERMFNRHPLTQFVGGLLEFARLWRNSTSNASSGWMLTLRPLVLVVHWAFKEHWAQVYLGKWTKPPGTEGISCSAGQRMSCRSQSSADEPSVHLSLDQPLAESHQCSFAKRCLFSIDTIQDKLPTSVHHGRLNDFIIGDPCIRLQDQRQSQHRRGHRTAALALLSDTGSPILAEMLHLAIRGGAGAKTQTIWLSVFVS